MDFSETSRRSVVADRFYPGDPNTLRDDVNRFLQLRPKKLVNLEDREVLGLLVPHAGYIFSGPVAGLTFGRISLPDRIIVLGPNHTGAGTPISVWNGGPWITPLGAVPIDQDASRALVDANAGFSGDMNAHIQEHSHEVLVPFFQVMNPNVRMTAIVVSGLPFSMLQAAGNALADVLLAAEASGEKILLVVSSDMSHYLPHSKAVPADTMALEAMKTLDPEKFFAVVRDNGISMCGVFPMTMAMFALSRLGADSFRVLAYASSGQTGRAYGADMDKVVGYAGAVMTR